MSSMMNVDGTASPRPTVGAAVWHSFDRALARAVRAGVGDDVVVTPPALDAGALCLRGAVTGVVMGQGIRFDALPDAGAVATLAERVRRYLGEELRLAPAADSFGAVHVFSALADVRARIDGAAPTPAPDGCAALELAVEVAHDMRSPLSAILFLVDMMRTGRSGAVTELQQQQLALVYAAALGLNQLTCDLLDFVRGDDLLDRAPSPFSLAAMLGGIRDLAGPAAEEKGVALHFETPARDERRGTPAALGRILLNLTSNAIRYTASGTIVVCVRELDGDRLEFSVQDAGGAVPADVIPQLFQPFREGGHGVRAFSGSGLGLAICHRLVAALGTELRVSTASGAGARFWFELDLPAV